MVLKMVTKRAPKNRKRVFALRVTADDEIIGVVKKKKDCFLTEGRNENGIRQDWTIPASNKQIEICYFQCEW